MRKFLLPVLILILCFYFYHKKNHSPAEPVETMARPEKKLTFSIAQPTQTPAPQKIQISTASAPVFVPRPQSKNQQVEKTQESGPLVMPYVLDEGIAVIQGDIAIGRPTSDDAGEKGLAEVPTMHLWPTNVIPYHLQADLSHPERVKEAIALFEGTNIQFVPYTDQQDILVFEESSGLCKSYVGKVGGKQQVWISPECAPREIAHEIMHALGFVHEQNRTDRDESVAVNFDNIDERYKENFDKLPTDFMKISGQAPFDFESLMLYPPWMFAKNGQSTMQSKVRDHQILPSNTLSKSDIERINLVYHN